MAPWNRARLLWAVLLGKWWNLGLGVVSGSGTYSCFLGYCLSGAGLATTTFLLGLG